MKYPKVRDLIVGAASAVAIVAASQGALADSDHHRGTTYKVTIHNLTLGQAIAPVLLVTHDRRFKLFEDHGKATPGLEDLAERGNSQSRASEIYGADGVSDVEVTAGPTPQGPDSDIVGEIHASGHAKYLSAAAMLGITNDAFFAVRGVPLPEKGKITVYADAYDAGTEVNTETKDDVGALGGDPFSGPDEDGFIHIHSGVHGVGGPDGLDPAVHDWRNPVVSITIERVHYYH